MGQGPQGRRVLGGMLTQVSEFAESGGRKTALGGGRPECREGGCGIDAHPGEAFSTRPRGPPSLWL